jgi:hypothetical protein
MLRWLKTVVVSDPEKARLIASGGDQEDVPEASAHGWFIKHGEVAATTGLAFLLEEEPLRVAFLSHLNAQTGIDVSGVTHFVPEAVHGEGDLARPDLASGVERHWRTVRAFGSGAGLRRFATWRATCDATSAT